MAQSQFEEFLEHVKNGDVEAVKSLLPFVDVQEKESAALGWAAYDGHIELFKLLLPLSDPKASESEALRGAASNGHIDIVKLLLPLSDPEAHGSCALRWATQRGRVEVIDLLYPVSDVDGVLKLLRKEDCKGGGFPYLERRFKAEKDKKFLKSNIISKNTSIKRSKKM